MGLKLDEAVVEDVTPLNVVFARATCRHDQIGDALGPAYGAVMTALQAAGVEAIGPPYARWTHWREEDCDFEAGLPVAEPFAGAEGVEAGVLQGRVVKVSFFGGYEGLQGAHRELGAWIEASEHDFGKQPCWEVYVTDPCNETDPEKVQTDLYWPIA